jgi:HEAT repeat protein
MSRIALWAWGIFILMVIPILAVVQVSDMVKKLLYGDAVTRTEAVKEFNKLPSEAQYKLVPEFMVALTDEDPNVRRIASRILKSMDVKTEGQIPDAKTALPPQSPKSNDQEKWAEEKKMKDAAPDKWADLKKMRTEDASDYSKLKEQLETEKKGQVTLDASQLQANAQDTSSPLLMVAESLKDPDPWVRAAAARRLAMVHPAPMDAIPSLIAMLGNKEPECRRAAAAALGSFGPLAKPAITALDAALSDPDPAVKLIVTDALKLIKQPQ